MRDYFLLWICWMNHRCKQKLPAITHTCIILHLLKQVSSKIATEPHEQVGTTWTTSNYIDNNHYNHRITILELDCTFLQEFSSGGRKRWRGTRPDRRRSAWWGNLGKVWFFRVSPVAHRITHINSIIINGNSTIINSVYYNDYVWLW